MSGHTSVFGAEEVKCNEVPLSVDYELPEEERLAFQHDLDTLVSVKVYEPEPQVVAVELCDSDKAIREQQIEGCMKYFGMSKEDAIAEVDGFVRDSNI